MEPQTAPPSRLRLTGAYSFTIGAIVGSIGELVAPGQFGRRTPLYDSLACGTITGGIILPLIQRTVPPYSLGERGVFTASHAAGLLAGIMVTNAVRQYF